VAALTYVAIVFAENTGAANIAKKTYAGKMCIKARAIRAKKIWVWPHATIVAT
jgi:hypothetical protein